jgi:hypothetical protein
MEVVMTLEEKTAWITLIGFLIVTIICGILLTIGADALGWQKRHLYLVCLAFTGFGHLSWLIGYTVMRFRLDRNSVPIDERDRNIHSRANAIAARLCCGFFFVATLYLGFKGMYLDYSCIETSTMFLVVLVAALTVMLTQSLAMVIMYRLR